MLSVILWALSGLAIPPNHNALPVPEFFGKTTLASVGLVIRDRIMGCVYVVTNKVNVQAKLRKPRKAKR